MSKDEATLQDSDSPPGTLGLGVRLVLAVISLALLTLTVIFTGWKDTESLPTVALIVVASIAGFLACAGKLPMRFFLKDGMGFDMTPEKVDQIQKETLKELFATLGDDLRDKILDATVKRATDEQTLEPNVSAWAAASQRVSTQTLNVVQEARVFEQGTLSELQQVAEKSGWTYRRDTRMPLADALLSKETAGGTLISVAIVIKDVAPQASVAWRNQVVSLINGSKFDYGILMVRGRIEVLNSSGAIWTFKRLDQSTLQQALMVIDA